MELMSCSQARSEVEVGVEEESKHLTAESLEVSSRVAETVM